MSAGVHVIAKSMHYWLSSDRHLISVQSLLTQQPIHRSRRDRSKELALRIGPKIIISCLQ